MIIYHKTNQAGFAVPDNTIWIGQPFTQHFSVAAGAAANEEIEQARSISRFVQSRIFGRVN